ncbi:galactose mutarotase-like enzyme [Hoeflea sp. IMCC20628]|uniref:aldose epimerase family protein n=1 Tax=Hoeflea sp. IMCC20628 TaxID=1620421 RepID=UPI00063AF867|nr:aldose epimerase family protein [Hoeflea sp. IMCC20628]AKH99681.1 galactose mutarotase-like enzyme [Hoeflea sp. IMCC20628]
MSHELEPIEIRGHGLLARVIPNGASLIDLRLEGVTTPLILGMAPECYVSHSHLYFGAVVGRHANRIAHGRATLNDKPLSFDINVPPHHSHGGQEGFSRQVWSISDRSESHVCFSLRSPDGHEGYPGDLVVTACYRLLPDAGLRLTYEATSTADTILNMCHHAYFNLDGRDTVDDHVLQIAADTYLPCDETVLPSGGPVPVAGTAFDFTAPRSLGVLADEGMQPYNNTYCLSDAPVNPLGFAARLTGSTGVSMEVWTTQPGLHLYNGYRIADCPPGIEGRHYGARAGVCLETQNWPDSPNRPEFPTSILRSGDHYGHMTEFRFAAP